MKGMRVQVSTYTSDGIEGVCDEAWRGMARRIELTTLRYGTSNGRCKQ